MNRHLGALAPVALLAACGGDIEPPPDPTTEPQVVEARIDSVEPDFGTNGGNDFVTITGGPFPTDPVVSLGGAEATILAATPNQLQISTPATDKTEWVPVRITGADGFELKQNRAYQLWEDGNGLAGLWGELYRLDYLGTYWTGPGTGGYTPPSQAQVRMVFLNPSDITYEDVWAPSWDGCEVGYSASLQATTIATQMESMTLSGSGGESIRLEPSTRDLNYMEALEIEALLLRPGTVYGLDSGASNGTWPAFGVDELATMPTRPEVLAPLLDAQFPPSVPADLDLQWVPADEGSYMAAIVSRTSSNGAVIEERATCLFQDDGAHTIPADTWSDWIPGEYLIIQLGRIHRTERILPHNRASNELVAVYWVYGAAQAL